MARRSKARVALAAELAAKRFGELDQRIVDAWALHQEAEPDISTERLFAMVETDTGADTDRQVQALRRAGLLQEKD